MSLSPPPPPPPTAARDIVQYAPHEGPHPAARCDVEGRGRWQTEELRFRRHVRGERNEVPIPLLDETPRHPAFDHVAKFRCVRPEELAAVIPHHRHRLRLRLRRGGGVSLRRRVVVVARVVAGAVAGKGGGGRPRAGPTPDAAPSLIEDVHGHRHRHIRVFVVIVVRRAQGVGGDGTGNAAPYDRDCSIPGDGHEA